MSSDSELVPSPLPSPNLQRGSPARGTVAKKCREFYLRRLERTAIMQKRWSMCEPSTVTNLENKETETDSPGHSLNEGNDNLEHKTLNENKASSTDEGGSYPLRKCRSSLDLAMDSLRKEISSLIAQDNDLFRQLLSLHDSIAELRERQRSCYSLYDNDDDGENIEEEDDDDDGRRERDDSPSLESLSDNGDLPETSPESTLSCRSSLSSDSVNSSSRGHLHHHNYHHHHHHRRYRMAITPNSRNRPSTNKKRHRPAATGNNDRNEPRPIVFVDKSAEICFRCQKMAPPYRRSRSITNFYYYLNEDMDSYDSGIHLQGSHSDSDHEIFV